MNVREKVASTRYDALADAIRERIAVGTYPKGSKIPSESEFMEDTGLSRSTVRRALDVLVDEGLITKERGRGAFVAHTPPTDDSALMFHSFTSSMESQGERVSTRTVDATTEKAEGGIAKFLNVPAGTDLVKLVRLRYLNDEPLYLETTYLPAEFQTILSADLDGSLYALLRRTFNRAPAHGHKTFEVCFATQNESFLLNVARDTALMLITDYVLDTQDRPLHVSKRVVRTDLAKYTEPI